MADHPAPPDPDPLLAEILAIAASLDHDELRLDLSDPALAVLVDRAVAPYAHVLTPEGMAKARETATFALATHPDVEALLARERGRARIAQQGSGVQATRSAGRLEDVARRKQGKRSR
jgi:hypothetical protein